MAAGKGAGVKVQGRVAAGWGEVGVEEMAREEAARWEAAVRAVAVGAEVVGWVCKLEAGCAAQLLSVK